MPRFPRPNSCAPTRNIACPATDQRIWMERGHFLLVSLPLHSTQAGARSLILLTTSRQALHNIAMPCIARATPAGFCNHGLIAQKVPFTFIAPIPQANKENPCRVAS